MSFLMTVLPSAVLSSAVLSSAVLSSAVLLSALPMLSGCGRQEQTAACQTFVECALAYQSVFSTDPIETVDYQQDGSCWDDPRVAEACDQQCIDTTAAYRATLDAANESTEPCQ